MKCTRRDFLKKGGIATAGSTLAKASNNVPTDWLAKIQKSIGFCDTPRCLQYLRSIGVSHSKEAFNNWIALIQRTGFTLEQWIQYKGLEYMDDEFGMYLEDMAWYVEIMPKWFEVFRKTMGF